MNRRSLTAVVSSLVLLGTLLPSVAAADPQVDRPLPKALADLKIDSPVTIENAPRIGTLGRSLLNATGQQSVVVRLVGAPSADVAARGDAAQRGQLTKNKAEQKRLIARAVKLDRRTRVLGTAQKALNAVMVRMDAAAIRKLAADPSVISIRPVIDYQLDLSGTVPYIGGTAVQAAGFDGTGVRVAVLDSGIDYTHVAFGGAGTAAAYTAAYGTTLADARNRSRDGLFPTAKVIGGWDFVGESWPATPVLAPDSDPIDCGSPPIAAPCDGGHGTHVADIIAGVKGVAPKASLYALKVCSAVSTSCSGVALIQAMDFAVDPNGDGSTADHVDIVNMSLGSPYGQAGDDDLSFAVDVATRTGVLTVASAGNSGDKPYANGTPAAAKTALSVAQTNVPSEVQPLMRIVSPATIAGDYAAVWQPWSAPLTAAIEAPVQYGDGAGGNLNGCAAFAAGSLTGKIVLVNRGACTFSAKIRNIGVAGGLVGIIALITPGDPFQGGFGGETPQNIPGYMISQADGNLIKANLPTPGVVIRFDPANGVPLVGVMVGSSSRGPSMVDNRIKPEIGAPGASISAVAGSGNGTEPFGGTSGAAPMVSGAAALLHDAFPRRSPSEIKAVLMNTAETDIMNTAAFFGGRLAPITRIGGGEVRVDRALASKAAAWDSKLKSGALSFGFVDATQNQTLTRQVTVRNYSNRKITYAISASFRFAEDGSGAVRVTVPSRITVSARETATFDVKLRINASKLPAWNLDSGALGASGDALTAMEFDGYVWLNETGTRADDADPLHLAWQVLPRLSGDVEADDNRVQIDTTAFGLPAGTTKLKNRGAGTAPVDAYSLIATSPNDPNSGPGDLLADVDLRAIGVQTFEVPAGFCSANPSFLMAFVANTWDRQSHANAPSTFEFHLDLDQNGTFDYAVFNFDLSLAGSLGDGRNATFVQNLTTNAASAFFLTDHGTNSTNTVLVLCAEQLGLTRANYGDPMNAKVLAFDWYNSGLQTDSVTGLTISPLGERYFGIFGTGEFGSTDIAPGASKKLTVVDFGAAGTNPTEIGLLLLTDAARADWRGGAVRKKEALIIRVQH